MEKGRGRRGNRRGREVGMVKWYDGYQPSGNRQYEREKIRFDFSASWCTQCTHTPPRRLFSRPSHAISKQHVKKSNGAGKSWGPKTILSPSLHDGEEVKAVQVFSYSAKFSTLLVSVRVCCAALCCSLKQRL